MSPSRDPLTLWCTVWQANEQILEIFSTALAQSGRRRRNHQLTAQEEGGALDPDADPRRQLALHLPMHVLMQPGRGRGMSGSNSLQVGRSGLGERGQGMHGVHGLHGAHGLRGMNRAAILAPGPDGRVLMILN